MNRRHTTIRAGWLAFIILMLLMSGAVFLLPVAGAAGGATTLPSNVYDPIIIRPTLSGLIQSEYNLKVTLTVDSNNVTVNTPTTLQATVTYANGTPAIGAVITLTATPSGVYFEKTSFTAVSSNTFVTKFQAPAEGSYTIKATATKDGYNTGTASQAVTFTKPAVPVTPTPTLTPTPTPLPATPTPVVSTAANNTTAAGGFDMGGLGAVLPFAAIVAVILLIILIVLAYLWLKRSLRLEPKKLSAPCDGKSTIPIRVSFVNGLGMTRRARSDTEITLDTTAGSIQNVVLQNGRDFVDAALTASREFGPVTVTAYAGGKTARSALSFVYDKAVIDLAITPESIPADGKSSSSITVRIKDGSGNFIAPLVERAIDLKSTLGSVASPIKMPPKVPSVSSSVTSGEVSGIAVITAASGDLRGEARLTIEGTAKRFCMHCGSIMTMEASQCPKCGLIPPSGVDAKQCPTCGTVVPESAMFCYQCGARQPETVKPQPPQEPVKK